MKTLEEQMFASCYLPYKKTAKPLGRLRISETAPVTIATKTYHLNRDYHERILNQSKNLMGIRENLTNS
jgi:hypothetical protein